MLCGASFGRDSDAVMKLRNVEQSEPAQEHGNGGGANGRGFGLADQAQVTEDTGMLMTTDTHRDQQCSPYAPGSVVCFIGSAFPRTYVCRHIVRQPHCPDTSARRLHLGKGVRVGGRMRIVAKNESRGTR